jgi:two-component system phosphate regulon sensor histidine kinase PhoR
VCQLECNEVISSPELQLSLQSVLTTGESVSDELMLSQGGQLLIFQIYVMPLLSALWLEQAVVPEGLPETAALLPASVTPPLEEVSGGVSGCVVVFHDITAIRRTEKMRRDFVANVSHELRTPLSAIKGYAETLLDGALDDETVSFDFVNIIHNHAIRLSRLVEDLLDLSKLESPDFRPELSPTALPALIQHTMSVVADAADVKEIALSARLPQPVLPLVLANAVNLEQVFFNLLDNAIKYTPAGGTIVVEAFVTPNTQGDSVVQVNVVDTGMGIEAKHIPRLFERFYRVDKARSRDMGGTGLGLSIVKHIIQLHGGEIWVRSEPNKGSTFSFTLRLAV